MRKEIRINSNEMDRESRFYLTNKEFLKELEDYQETKKVSERLGEIFEKLSTKIANRSNFYKYTYREDMIREGILTCLTYIDSFNPEISKNPFSYFTMAIYRSFVATIKSEKKQSDIKVKIRETVSDGRTLPKRVQYDED